MSTEASSAVRSGVVLGAIGLFMGFALSRIGFASWDEVHAMFTFASWRLILAFLTGVVGARPGVALDSSSHRGDVVTPEDPPRHAGGWTALRTRLGDQRRLPEHCSGPAGRRRRRPAPF